MTVATFIIPDKTADAEEAVHFTCVECDTAVPASESDVHATRKHKAQLIRVFSSRARYEEFLTQEAS